MKAILSNEKLSNIRLHIAGNSLTDEDALLISRSISKQVVLLEEYL